MIPHQYQWVTDEKCLHLQKVSRTHPRTQTHTYIRQHLVPPSLSTTLLPYLTCSVWRASGWPACVCVCAHACMCVCVCVAPVESDKGRLWEAETEALDNGKAYLIDGPTRNTEHATYTHKHTHSHITRLPNSGLVETLLLLVIIMTRGHPPFNDKD